MASRGIPRPVWFLGWASLFTDAATEMIYPLLPVYLSRVLGAGALSLGVIEGVAEGINSALKVISGYWADRRPRRRPIVILGYSLSSVARPLIAMTTSWLQVLVVRALDRTGKGIRGAPRDALLAQLAEAPDRGRVFGFHRAMDHAGAIVGPLVATAILFLAPGQYRLVFALAAVPGAIAVAMLFLVHEDPSGRDRSRVPATPDVQPTSPVTRRPIASSNGAEAPARVARGRLPLPLVMFFIVLLIFSLGSSADAFLLLRLSDALGGDTWILVLWSALHVVKASLSTWGGTLSDRWGRKPVIVAGWIVYALVYLGFGTAQSASAFVAWFLVYGIYFALTEGAEKALVADLTPAAARGTAFGYYNAALGIGTSIASVVFGLVYERFGAATAFNLGAGLAGLAAFLLVCIPVHRVAAAPAAAQSAAEP